ncbi:MAG: DNA-processing protein DprA, partial [Prevotella denticola]
MIPDAYNFLQRNRIIAGIAAATIVVESPIQGGALATANYCLEY